MTSLSLSLSLSSILPIFHTPYLTVSACIAVCLHRSLSLSLTLGTHALSRTSSACIELVFLLLCCSISLGLSIALHLCSANNSISDSSSHSLSLSICTGSIADQHDVRHRPHHRKAKPQAELSTLRNIQ